MEAMITTNAMREPNNPRTLISKNVSYEIKGALNPNFLNLTKNREKFCL